MDQSLLPRAGAEMKRGIARITEEMDDEGYFTATFACHCESDGTPVDVEFGPQGLDIDAALEWARNRASLVIVRIGDKHFSAGEAEFSEGAFPRWPAPAGTIELVRRRP